MSGDFTSRFDAEILRSRMAEIAREQKRAEKERAEKERAERDLAEIGKVLDRRAGFIRERFPNASAEEFAGTGFQFVFAPKERREKGARFSLRARFNDSRMAILVASCVEIPDANAKEYDYVSLPIHRVDLERAKRFIEAKLLDFARAYVG